MTIISTKLGPPRIGSLVLERPRLLKLLEQNLDKKLILILAGVGYGKTTLLLHLISKIEPFFVWYSLDKTDTDLAVFIHYIITGIRRLSPSFGLETESVIEGVKNISQNIEVVIGTFINEIVKFDKQLFIILDDYHCLNENPSINKAIDYLLDYSPRNLHLVVSTQTKPSLSTVRLNSKGELIEISEDDLIFTREETEILFSKIYGFDVDSGKLQELEKHFEGWVTGLQLIFQHKDIKKSLTEYEKVDKTIFDYLAEEIFNHQTEELQIFLMESSILDYLNTEVCNEVLKIKNSRTILLEIEKRHLFTTQLHNEFKYHPLFKEFLRVKLIEDCPRARVMDLYQRAATSFEKIENWGEAITHYVHAGMYEKVSEILEKIAENLIREGKLYLVNNWLDILPQEIIKNRPWLLYYKGSIMRCWGEWNKAGELQEKAMEIFEEKGERKGVCKTLIELAYMSAYRGEPQKGMDRALNALQISIQENNYCRGKALNVLGAVYTILGDYHRAVKTLKTALLYITPEEKLAKSIIMQNIGAVHCIRGEFSKAMDIYQKILSLSRHKPILASGATYNNIATLHRVMGNLEEAEIALKKAIRISQKYADRAMEAGALINFGGLYQEMDKQKEALFSYKHAEKICSELGITTISTSLFKGMSAFYLQQHDLYKADEYINKCRLDPINLETVHSLMIKGVIKLESGDIQESEKILISCLDVVEKSGAKYELMRLHFYMAKLYLKSSGKKQEKVKKHLIKALSLAKKNAYHQFLIIEAKEDISLLKFALNNKIRLDYTIYLLSQIGLPSLDILISLLEQKESKTRQIAAMSLATLGDRKALEPLEILAIKEQNPDVKEAVKYAISSLNKKVIEDFQGYDMVARLFGEVEVLIGDLKISVRDWHSEKGKELLCYFIVNKRRRITRDKLMDVFWRDKSPHLASSSLRTTIYYLRNALNIVEGYELVLCEHPHYFINPSYNYWIDTEVFQKLVKEGDYLCSKGIKKSGIEKYEEAVNLYRGDLLNQFYSSWIDEDRRYFGTIFLESLEKMARYYFDIKEYKRSIKCCRRILMEDEIDENIHALLMQCYGKTGNKQKVIHQYETLIRILKDELGEEPSDETTGIYKILTQKA